jgi:hypothetical protein
MYCSLNNMSKCDIKTIIVEGKGGNKYRFQNTEYLFTKNNGEECKAIFAVPLDFNGDIRLWTTDFEGRKVWSTMDMIEKYNCNPFILFDFLGKYTHRFTIQEMSDDLPF